jgi:hypothetical protein
VLKGGRIAFIELKVGRGELSPAQLEFRDRAVALGAEWHLVRSFEEFRELVDGWGAAGLFEGERSDLPERH